MQNWGISQNEDILIDNLCKVWFCRQDYYFRRADLHKVSIPLKVIGFTMEYPFLNGPTGITPLRGVRNRPLDRCRWSWLSPSPTTSLTASSGVIALICSNIVSLLREVTKRRPIIRCVSQWHIYDCVTTKIILTESHRTPVTQPYVFLCQACNGRCWIEL